MSNNDYLEHFELPRLDWHDAEGRINKTALIDNFNAIEEKMHELINLPPIGWAGIDFDTFDYDDTTLESDDNKVVNLKSLIDIMNLKGVVINCKFSGKKLTSLKYYNDNYQKITLKDVDIPNLGENDKVYIYLDYQEAEVYASSNGNNPNDDVLIGLYYNDQVYELNGAVFIDCNILNKLAQMKMRIRSYNNFGEIYSEDNVQNGKGFRAAAYSTNKKKRTIGLVCRESGGQDHAITFRDLGV